MIVYTRISNSILNQYKAKSSELLQDAGVYICKVCGYIHIGDELPDICPVCRVANFKILKVEG